MTNSKENPMRWDCEDGKNCFNRLMRPKIEVFAECLPGKCQFTDVDGLTEVNGYGLLLEWKSSPGVIVRGQSLAYERLTKTGLIYVLVLAGDAETMRVTHKITWRDGKASGGWEPTNLNDAKQVIRDLMKIIVSLPRPKGLLF
jgi:hypothetical protein